MFAIKFNSASQPAILALSWTHIKDDLWYQEDIMNKHNSSCSTVTTVIFEDYQDQNCSYISADRLWLYIKPITLAVSSKSHDLWIIITWSDVVILLLLNKADFPAYPVNAWHLYIFYIIKFSNAIMGETARDSCTTRYFSNIWDFTYYYTMLWRVFITTAVSAKRLLHYQP